ALANTGDPLQLDRIKHQLALLAGANDIEVDLEMPFEVPDSLTYRFHFVRTFASHVFDLDLAAGGDVLGFEADTQFSLTPKLEISFEFGIEDLLAQNLVESFFVEVDNIAFTLELGTEEPLNAAANITVVRGEIQDGSVMAGVTLAFALPRVTGVEICEPGFSFNPLTQGEVTLNGTLDVVAPLFLSFAGVPLTSGEQPVLRIADGNLFDANLPVFAVENYENLINLRDISLTRLIQAIQGLVTFIAEQVGGSELLDKDLPLIGRSVNDIFEVANELAAIIEDLKNGGDTAIQDIEARIEAVLGLDPGELVASYLPAEDTFLFDFSFVLASTTVNVAPQFNLADLTQGIAGAVDEFLDLEEFAGVTAAGNISLTANLILDFTFGLDISQTFQNPLDAFFLLDDASFTATLFAEGTNLEFTAFVGPLEARVTGGSFILDEDGDGVGTGPASLTVTLLPSGSNGRYTLTNLGSIGLQSTVVGGFHVSLPVEVYLNNVELQFPDEDTLAFRIPNLANFLPSLNPFRLLPQSGSVERISIPNFASLMSNFQFDSDLEQLYFWINQALQVVADAMDGELWGIKMPFIGDKLTEYAGFIHEIQDKLNAFLNGLAESTAIRQAILDALGPNGALGAEGIILDKNGDGDVNLQDITMTVDTLSGSIIFDIFLGQNKQYDIDAGFDLGLPGLGLEVDAGLS
ncbi:MAG: hypothetical protein KDM63_15940, partial [Verrucomicrobiae bacterium]|nr:hypothetical protein [Verrucomicrobiae bacterium]